METLTYASDEGMSSARFQHGCSHGDGLSEKVLAGERISAARRLSSTDGRSRSWGCWPTARRDLAKGASYDGRGREIVTYIVDRNINYTNVCNVYCKFCAFYRTEKDEDHYVLSRRAARSKARRTFRRGRRSNPDARRASSEVIVRLVRRFCSGTFGKNIRISIFTDSARPSFNISRSFSACRCAK